MKEKYRVTGMTCSSCVSHVEKAVQKLAGIDKVEVNLLSNSMQVQYDETKLHPEEIIQAIKEAGYEAMSYSSKKPKEENQKNNIALEEIKRMKKRLFISICFLIPLMYISMHHMAGEWLGFLVPDFIVHLFHGPQNAITYVFTQLLLLVPIMYVNRKYFSVGLKMLLKRTPNMDSLIAVGSLASILYGIFAIYRIGIGLGEGNIELVNHYTMDIYFESAGTILTLITLGKYLETKSKAKTSQAITKLMDLAPKVANIIRHDIEMTVPVEEVMIGDIVIVKPGGSIPVDGRIIEGKTQIDESAITGESIPVDKTIGDMVIAATINKSGYIQFKAEKVGEDTTLAQIIQLVEEANSSKAPIAKLADKISGVFVPIVMLIAIISTIIWIVLGYPFEFALSIGISVLVISCPCALGLATPVSIMVGTGKGAQNGILVKSAEGLEVAHLINTVVFDKTGTITKGKPVVTDIFPKEQKLELLTIIASLEQASEHPLAKAVMEEAKKENIVIQPVSQFHNHEGMGVEGIIQEEVYFVGNRKLMEESKIDITTQRKQEEILSRQGKTILYLAMKSQCIGIIAIADVVKETSKQTISELKKMQLETVMLTGDNNQVAQYVQTQVGVDQVIAEVLPQEKERKIQELQAQGKKVAMVGDGINDAPALARADLGVAIGAGTDIAIETADIILMKSDLLDFVTTIRLSKAVIRNIKMNLFWAFFYNIIGIPLAAGVFYLSLGWKLSPMFAAAAMSFSSVCVVLNALRLNKFKIHYQKKEEGIEKMRKVITIEGMQCNHCKMAVEKALNEIEGIDHVEVNVEEKQASVEITKEVPNAILKQAIENAGYTVIKIKE